MANLINGRSIVHRVPASGSEGPWYSDNFCGSIIIDGVTGENYVLWAALGASVVGSATMQTLVSSGNTISLITVTGDGDFQINQNSCAGGGLLAHLLPPGSPIMSVCG